MSDEKTRGGGERTYSHPSDEIRATGSRSRAFSSEADSMCFLRLVMGDLRFMHSLYGLHTLVKITKFEVLPSCLFGMCFRGGLGLFLHFSVLADILDPLPIRDDFSHCGPKLFP